MAGRVEGRVAVVTGAGQGIGRAVAERLAAEGARVVGGDIDASILKRTETALTGTGASFVGVVGGGSHADAGDPGGHGGRRRVSRRRARTRHADEGQARRSQDGKVEFRR